MESVTNVIVPRAVLDDGIPMSEACKEMKDLIYKCIGPNVLESLELTDEMTDEEVLESLFACIDDSDDLFVSFEEGYTLFYSKEEVDTEIFKNYLKENNIVTDYYDN